MSLVFEDEPDRTTTVGTIAVAAPIDAGPPLSVMSYVAPDLLCGMPMAAMRSQQISMMPQASADGILSFSGLAAVRNDQYQRDYRWEFRTYRSVADQRTGVYNMAECKWTANPKNDQVELARPMRAAIAIEHKKKPFVRQAEDRGSTFERISTFQNRLSGRLASDSDDHHT